MAKRDHLALSYQGKVTDDVLERQRDELDEANRRLLASMDEKNSLIDEIEESSKSLQNTNTQIQLNIEKIASLKQELEFLKEEHASKEKRMFK